MIISYLTIPRTYRSLVGRASTAIPSPSTALKSCKQHPKPQTKLHTRNMASATSFYDFKPLDSKSIMRPPANSQCSQHTQILARSPIFEWPKKLTPACRERPTLRLLHPPQQSHPRRQHRLEMRIHPAVRRPRDPLQENHHRNPSLLQR